jgi:hypothetical protein
VALLLAATPVGSVYYIGLPYENSLGASYISSYSARETSADLFVFFIFIFV